MANTIYYKVYLLISVIIKSGGVSSFNAFSTNELKNNFHHYCVIPENILTPPPNGRFFDMHPLTPQGFPFQGDL